MDRFIVGCGFKEYYIDIQDYKFIIGGNVQVKLKLRDVIKSSFNKISNSDYACETHKKHYLKFNEKLVDTKLWKYFEVTPFFDLETDLKMGTKSLINKYLDSLADDIEQNEIFNTLLILINSLNDEFFDKETTFDIGDKQFKLQLSEVTRATISKEIYGILSSESLECNSADLSYEELILLQLDLIDKIANKNKEKLIFIYCYLPLITPKIYMKLLGIKYAGTYLVIDTSMIKGVDIEKCVLISSKYIDFANKNHLNDLIMDLPFHIELKDFVIGCQNIINKGVDGDVDARILEIFHNEIYTKNS